jgi:hypothetical protein
MKYYVIGAACLLGLGAISVLTWALFKTGAMDEDTERNIRQRRGSGC